MYFACEEGSVEIIKLFMDRVQFNRKLAIDNLVGYLHFKVAYELFPCDETRLYLACHEEDLETVKELYPQYPHSLVSKFENSSYELLSLLYRDEKDFEEDLCYGNDIFGMLKLLVEKGYADPQDLIGKYMYSLRTVKYLIEKGAKPVKGNYSPRVQRYLDSL